MKMKTQGQLMAERKPKPKFTEEQYQKICKTRAELEAYRDKIQPYPYIPPEEKPIEPKPIIKTVGLSSKERDGFNQLKSQLLFLQNKINVLYDKRKSKTQGHKLITPPYTPPLR